MKRSLTTWYTAALALAGAACQDSGSPAATASDIDVSNGFASLPVGFSNVQSTFAGSADSSWSPGTGARDHHGGPRGGDSERGALMCGGLGGFLDLGLGFGGRGRSGLELTGDCSFDVASGRVSCAPETRDGLTITRSAAYSDTKGAPQEGFDSSATNTVNTQVKVSGTREGRDGNTSTVEHSSDRTVSGLAEGSSQRTVEGTSAGKETTQGSDSTGTFEAVRTVGDTIQSVVLPVKADSTSYPTAGTIVRSMQVTLTYEGQPPSTSSRREVITFDGSRTAKVVITKDGETQNCTLALPGRQLSCS